MMSQTDLFGKTMVVQVEQDTHSWSHSRINALDSCPRKYFYAYYGGKKRSAPNIENKARIEFLSKLGNRALIMGTIIHDTIDYYFNRYKAGTNHDLGHLLSRALTKLEEVHRLSITSKTKPVDAGPNQKLFKELYYDRVDHDVFKNGIKEKIILNLTNFYEGGAFDFLRKGGKMKGALKENWVRMSILGFAKVIGKLDLCFEDYEENFVVADWKTGNLENEETSLQLMIYALWALEVKKVNKDNIKLYKAYLQEGTVEPLEFSDDHILRARMKVVQDTERMQLLHRYGIAGNESAFTRLAVRGKICDQCPFEEICHKTN